MLEDIDEHFDDFIEVINNFTFVDSFTYFETNTQKNVILSYTFLNETNFKEEITLEQLEWFFVYMDRRDFLLQLKEMEINLNMGKNERINNLNISVSYDLTSRMLLNVEINFDYTLNSSYIKI